MIDGSGGDWTEPERENADVIRRMIEAERDDDAGAFAELAGPEMTAHFLGSGAEPVTWTSDVKGFLEYRAELRAAIPDFEATVEDVVVDGDRVVLRSTVRGTPEQEYQGLPPTGESFEVPAFYMYRLEDGRVVEMWSLMNTLGVVQQLGVFPDSPGKVAKLAYGRLKRRLTGRAE